MYAMVVPNVKEMTLAEHPQELQILAAIKTLQESTCECSESHKLAAKMAIVKYKSFCGTPVIYQNLELFHILLDSKNSKGQDLLNSKEVKMYCQETIEHDYKICLSYAQPRGKLKLPWSYQQPTQYHPATEEDIAKSKKDIQDLEAHHNEILFNFENFQQHGFDRILIIQWADDKTLFPNSILRKGYSKSTKYAILAYKAPPHPTPMVAATTCSSTAVSSAAPTVASLTATTDTATAPVHALSDKKANCDKKLLEAFLHPYNETNEKYKPNLRPDLNHGWFLAPLAYCGNEKHSLAPKLGKSHRGFADSKDMTHKELEQFCLWGISQMQQTRFVGPLSEIKIETPLSLKADLAGPAGSTTVVCFVCMNSFDSIYVCKTCRSTVCQECYPTLLKYKKACICSELNLVLVNMF